MSLDKSILAQLKAAIQARPTLSRWVVAYSGGVDSTVLLRLVSKLNQELDKPLAIVALHINHQISSFADEWQQHCLKFTLKNAIPLVCESVSVTPSGQGIEAAARDARYAVFEHFLEQDDCLLMGHHRDDQAETILFRMLRGSGNLGLSGIPYERKVGSANLLRPLLYHSRAELVAYAQQQQLVWVEDDSNRLDNFDRNYLRNTVMPLLSERWSQANSQLAKTAALSTETQGLLNDLAENDFSTLECQEGRYGLSVDFEKLKRLSEARINNVIRYWCQLKAYDVPDRQQLNQIQTQFFLEGSASSSAIVSWGKTEVRYFNKRLYLMHTLANFSPSLASLSWDAKSDIDLIFSRLTVNENPQSGLSLPVAILDESIEITWRRGGERCTPSGRTSSQGIKKLLQEYQLETWLRDRVPLLYVNKVLAAVGDLWVCKEFAAKENEATFRIQWHISR